VWAALPLRRGVLPSVTARASVTWDEIKSVPRNRAFRRYLLVISLISLPFYLASPFYQVVHLEILHFRPSTIAYMTVGYYIVKSLMSRYCATLVSRLGADFMLSTTGFIYTMFFAGYVLAGPGHSWPVFAGWILLGVADAVFNIAQGTALFAVVPHTPARSAYFAVFNLILLAFYGVGGLVAMPILEYFEDKPLHVGAWSLNNFQCLFAIAVVLMIIGTILVRVIHITEPKPGHLDPGR
jgi:MFS family permease